MRSSRVRALLTVLAALGCGSADHTPPSPPATYANWCRCAGPPWTLTVVRVETTPVPFRDTRYSIVRTGVEYDVIIERSYPGGEWASRPPAPSSMRIRARQYLADGGGAPILPATGWDHPQYTMVAPGQRVVANFVGRDPDDGNRWSLNIVAVVSASDTLSRRLFSFPAGTPVGQMFDATEWICTPDASRRGDCLPDGGAAATPSN